MKIAYKMGPVAQEGIHAIYKRMKDDARTKLEPVCCFITQR